MPKYRIWRPNGNADAPYYPQIRRWWWPFWCYLHWCSYTGHDWSPRGFMHLADAVVAIDAHRNPPPASKPVVIAVLESNTVLDGSARPQQCGGGDASLAKEDR